MTNFKQIALATGIAILSALFIILLVDAFYESPKYENFCDTFREFPKQIDYATNRSTCPDPYFKYRKEIYQCQRDKGFPEFDYDEKGCQTFNRCNFCEREFRQVEKKYNRNIFLIMAPLGITLILFGVFYKIAFLGSGFMFGGIIVLAYGTIRFFPDMNRYIRVIVIFIELVLLLLIGIKKIKK